jgi:hypothetical protein
LLFDAQNRVGRKRRIAVDTDGRLLMVNLTTADIADSAGAQLIGWMTRWRRLGRDYEQHIDVSKAMVYVAMGNLLLRRISH